MRLAEASGWINKGCEEYRVILMDQVPHKFRLLYLSYSISSSSEIFESQRGTGLSTPLTPSSMSQFKSAEELSKYLTHFRADNIVNDAEFIRKRLVPDSKPWTVLGQVKYPFLFPLICVYKHICGFTTCFNLLDIFIHKCGSLITFS